MITELDKVKLLALKNGDEQVFESIFREFYAPLCLHARRYLIDPDIAEEVVQDMFFKMWDRRDSLTINSSLAAYLYKSVTNHALNYLKYQKHIQKYQEYVGFRTDDNVSISAHDALVNSDLEKELLRLIKSMPERRRMIFEMSRHEGLRYNDIAEKLGISVKTVEVQMSKALEFMRNKLRDYLPVLLVFWLLSSLF
ncbi:MAG: RNA polymerase sigma-70 factor [Lentimicrobiaceae bacterium]|nr:RNA polymerase sigma-70 factor [Lentimicrobiaceae bacterium]MCB9024627.1 RNA polymerase sigma-70 factor [Lentimicrobiaceae bacterium]MCO5264501.1 RNA polymerase sigma-70 factor [Lentimicrobium sp.]